jgi:hypothetical protein
MLQHLESRSLECLHRGPADAGIVIDDRNRQLPAEHFHVGKSACITRVHRFPAHFADN